MRMKLALMLALVLLGCSALIPQQVLSETVDTKSTQRITLLNPRRRANDDAYKKSLVSFRRYTYTAERGPNDDWDLRYGGLSFNGDRDWFIVTVGPGDRSRIKDLGEMEWSDDIVVPVLPILPCPTNDSCGRIRIPPSSSGKRIEDVNPHIAKPMVGHMYLVHTYDKERDLGYPVDFDIRLDFYTLVRVEELKPNESCTITWRVIP